MSFIGGRFLKDILKGFLTTPNGTIFYAILEPHDWQLECRFSLQGNSKWEIPLEKRVFSFYETKIFKKPSLDKCFSMSRRFLLGDT